MFPLEFKQKDPCYLGSMENKRNICDYIHSLVHNTALPCHTNELEHIDRPDLIERYQEERRNNLNFMKEFAQEVYEFAGLFGRRAKG